MDWVKWRSLRGKEGRAVTKARYINWIPAVRNWCPGIKEGVLGNRIAPTRAGKWHPEILK